MRTTHLIYSGLFVLALLLAKCGEAQVASSSNPALVSQPVLLVASVEVPQGVTALPTGTMTFLDGGIALGTVEMVAGEADLTTQFSTVGTHSITASYSGDAVFSPAVSPPFTESITADTGFTLSVAPPAMFTTAGGSGSTTVTVFANGSVAAATPVTLSCESLPAGTQCNFGGNTLIPAISGAMTGLEVTTTAKQSQVWPFDEHGVMFARMGMGLGCACLVIPVFFLRRRLILPRPLFALVITAFALVTVGCGTKTQVVTGGTPQGTYTIQVVATGNGLTRVTPVQFVVH